MSAADTSSGRLLPGRRRGETAALREEIARLEQEQTVQEDALVRRWRDLQGDVEQAQTGTAAEQWLRFSEDAVRGHTLCARQGRKGRCAFENGKCKHCGRQESAFRYSYSIQSWREQEQKVWEEQKEREAAALETKSREQQRELDAQWEQLALAKANFTFEREQVMAMVQKDREALHQQKQDIERQRREAQEWHDRLQAALQAEREAFHAGQQKAAAEAEQRWQELAEIDQKGKAAAVLLERQRHKWDEECRATRDDFAQQKASLRSEVQALELQRAELAEQEAALEEARQVHAEKLEEYRAQCARWMQEEREALRHQRSKEEVLITTYVGLYKHQDVRRLEHTRVAARQLAAADPAFVPEAYPAAPSTPRFQGLALASGAYSIPPGPDFPRLTI